MTWTRTETRPARGGSATVTSRSHPAQAPRSLAEQPGGDAGRRRFLDPRRWATYGSPTVATHRAGRALGGGDANGAGVATRASAAETIGAATRRRVVCDDFDTTRDRQCPAPVVRSGRGNGWQMPGRTPNVAGTWRGSTEPAQICAVPRYPMAWDFVPGQFSFPGRTSSWRPRMRPSASGWSPVPMMSAATVSAADWSIPGRT